MKRVGGTEEPSPHAHQRTTAQSGHGAVQDQTPHVATAYVLPSYAWLTGMALSQKQDSPALNVQRQKAGTGRARNRVPEV